MSERQHVEIDYCPKCRGVWLDRGELDKIIERATQQLEEAWAPRPEAVPPPRPDHRPPPGYEQPAAHRAPMGTYGSPPPGYRSGYGRKRRSFLSEMFDF